jgi:hypothetical protein
MHTAHMQAEFKDTEKRSLGDTVFSLLHVCHLCIVSYCSTTATGLKPICSFNK